jgi:hypothetical protein
VPPRRGRRGQSARSAGSREDHRLVSVQFMVINWGGGEGGNFVVEFEVLITVSEKL